MLHTKCQGHLPFGSREEDFFKVCAVFRRTWTDTEELLKEKSFFHTFFCVLVRICNQTSSNQHLLVVGC